MSQLTCTRSAWLTEPVNLVKIDRSDAGSIHEYSYYLPENADYSGYGWVKLGTAQITITLEDNEEELTRKSVEALNAAIEKIEEEHDKKVQVLKEAISKLQCIGYSKPAVVESDDPDFPF